MKNKIQLLALTKGIDKINGKETFYKGFDKTSYYLPAHHLGFLVLRHIRDVAHNFAIKIQQKKLLKNGKTSMIENISGVGSKKRQALLNYFGG